MKIDPIREQALALPEVTEEPHFHYSSFRVRGKIFITLPPDGEFIHLFVDELERERALNLYPEFCEKLLWGSRVAGLRLKLAKAKPTAVQHLVLKAWRNKAPKRLLATVTDGI